MLSSRIFAQKSSNTVIYVSRNCIEKFWTVNITESGDPPLIYDDSMMAGSERITPTSSQMHDFLTAKMTTQIWYPATMFLLDS